MEPTVNIGKLNKRRILALRNADHIQFTYMEPNVTEITCYKEQENNPANFTKDSFFVASSVITSANKPQKVKKASYLAEHTSYDWEIQTVLGTLQITDEIELIWMPNALLVPETKPRVYGDILKVIVFRDEFQFHYRVGQYIGTDFLRMITPC